MRRAQKTSPSFCGMKQDGVDSKNAGLWLS